MQPSKDPASNYDSLESEFASSRDALLQATCALLEGLCFKTSAWNVEAYDLLNHAFTACVVEQLPPRTVITKLLQVINKEAPGDTHEELLSIIIDVAADLENPLNFGTDDHTG